MNDATLAVAILTTGDEVVNGDILNQNAKNIAHDLFQAKITVGHHLSVKDDIPTIRDAIDYLAKQHAAVIITGGLGPTRDDITRDALSEYIQAPLVLDPGSLKQMEAFLVSRGVSPQNGNQRQALFPENATIIPNPLGTAAGCLIEQNGCLIVLLPGPPRENLPMFREVVRPKLKHLCCDRKVFKRWLVFSLAESVVAKHADETLAPYTQDISYRFRFPYTEVKAFFNQDIDIATVEKQLAAAFIPQARQLLTHTYSEQLSELAASLAQPIRIQDNATGGTFAQQVLTPANHRKLLFDHPLQPSQTTHAVFVLDGLTGYWQQQPQPYTKLRITQATQTTTLSVKNYGAGALQHATELAAQHILRAITEIDAGTTNKA